MSIESHDDPWLSPTRQAEFPSRLVLSTVKLHRRREKTFLVLAALAMLSAIAVPLFGTRLVLDARYMVESIAPDLAVPAAEIAFGVLLLPLGLFAMSLVAELYGRRRAYAMAVVGLLMGLAAVGLLYASEQIDGGGEAIGASAALAVAAFVGQLVLVPVHANMRRNAPGRRFWARKLVATLVGLLAAWTVFAFVLYAHAVQMYGRAEDDVIADIGRLVIGGAAYTVVVALLDVIPFVAIARGLALYLRVGPFEEAADDESLADSGVSWSRPRRVTAERSAPAVVDARPRRRSLPPALLVETPPPVHRARRTSIQPFSSAEMRFFTEGEELAEAVPVDATDAKSARI